MEKLYLISLILFCAIFLHSQYVIWEMKKLHRQIEKMYDERQEILIYCLTKIHNEAVADEDYEKAQRALLAIKKLTSCK